MTTRLSETIAVRDLKNRLSEVLRAVERGEHVTVTVDRRAVAELVPVSRKPRWIDGARFLAHFEGRWADPGLRAELDELVGDTIDEL